jgi:hypothetical protein
LPPAPQKNRKNTGIFLIAFAEEVKAEGGFADPGRTKQQCRRVLRETATHYEVELSNTGLYRRPDHTNLN